MIYILLVQAAQSLFSINIINNPFVIINAVVNDNLLSIIGGKHRYLTTSHTLGGAGLNLVKHNIPRFNPVNEEYEGTLLLCNPYGYPKERINKKIEVLTIEK